MRFANVGTVQQAQTPGLLNAELARARIDSANKQKEYQQKQDMLAGVATVYDKWTGEETPIRDFLRAQFDGADAEVPVAGGPAAGSAMAAEQAAADAGGAAVDTAMETAAMGGGPAAASAMAAEKAAGVGEAAEGVADGASGVPLVSALRGAGELAEGDLAGAAGAGLQGYLSTLGPYGIAAGLMLGLLG